MRRVPPEELPYTVDAVDIVAEAPGLRVSVLSLAPGQEVPWHYHSHVTDTFFCLSGSVWVSHGADGRTRLEPGESHAVPARTPHQVESADDTPCRFLIVQGMGEYDFIPTRGPRTRS